MRYTYDPESVEHIASVIFVRVGYPCLEYDSICISQEISHLKVIIYYMDMNLLWHSRES